MYGNSQRPYWPGKSAKLQKNPDQQGGQTGAGQKAHVMLKNYPEKP